MKTYHIGKLKVTEYTWEEYRFMKTQKLYDIECNDGAIMPRHWSGRARTYEEAKKMVDSLNAHAEYGRKYKMIKAYN